MKPIRVARTCYDHLAGRIGVAVTEALVRMDAIIQVEPGEEFAVTAGGQAAFARMGIDVETVRARRRRFAGQCIDWTERRPHLSGALGSVIASRAIELGWFHRITGSRALEVTDRGWAALEGDLGITRLAILDSARPEACPSLQR